MHVSIIASTVFRIGRCFLDAIEMEVVFFSERRMDFNLYARRNIRSLSRQKRIINPRAKSFYQPKARRMKYVSAAGEQRGKSYGMRFTFDFLK